MKAQHKSALYMMVAAICFSNMSALTKSLATSLPYWQIVFFRGLVGVLILGTINPLLGITLVGNKPKLLLLRSVAGFIALLLNFYALANIKLVDEATLRQSTPIFVLILSSFWLKEKIRPLFFIIVAIAMCGIFLILKPSGEFYNLGGLAALGSAMFAAMAYLIVHRLHASEQSATISFYFSLMATLGTILPALYVWQQPTAKDWLMLWSMGILGTIGQITLTHAYKFSKASYTTLFLYTQVPISFLLGISFFGESPDLFSLLGIVLTWGSCVGLLLLKPVPKQDVLV